MYLYMHIYVIRGKNIQHFKKNFSATAFINSCQYKNIYINIYIRLPIVYFFKKQCQL